MRAESSARLFIFQFHPNGGTNVAAVGGFKRVTRVFILFGEPKIAPLLHLIFICFEEHHDASRLFLGNLAT